MNSPIDDGIKLRSETPRQYQSPDAPGETGPPCHSI